MIIGSLYCVDLDNANGNPEIYAKRFTGTTWEDAGENSSILGGISQNIGASNKPSLVIAPDGTPYVAWVDDDSGDNEIYILHYIE